MTINHIIRRVSVITIGMGLGLSFFTGTASAAPQAEKKGSDTPAQSSARQDCNGTHHSDTGHGANTDGPDNQYHNTCDGSASENGNGGGESKGKPCAGCVGNADDKNPPGQAVNGNDHNHGYECDVKGQPNGGNNGVGKGNPAHTGCAPAPETTQTPPSGGDDDKPKKDDNDKPKVEDKGKPKDDDKGKPSVDNKPDDPKGPCAGGAMTTDVNRDGVVDAKDCNPVQASVCANGTMTTDVNSDGVIDDRDCRKASVLGNELDRTSTAVAEVRTAAPVVRASRGSRPTEVLGVEFSRGAEVGPLALTGAPVDPSQLLLVAIALLVGGTVLMQARRRPTKAS